MPLTHLDPDGNARMVDVSDKDITAREAIAEGWIALSPAAFMAITEGRVKKGDVLAVAQLAGIAAAKRTPELVPLCHPIPLTGVKVMLEPCEGSRVRAWARVRSTWRTGVEMEALTCVTAALLTVYDMVKAIDKGPEIGPVRLIEKRGGRSGTWVRSGAD
ncbi:MAG: cyclic pyranopterin monophosphate synthase MoaC [Alphaproteobacteria bacterium]|nr:cyclic pyranopterin monophosphate synthase MoaC [Alphaproteobacteria bacterium]